MSTAFISTVLLASVGLAAEASADLRPAIRIVQPTTVAVERHYEADNSAELGAKKLSSSAPKAVNISSGVVVSEDGLIVTFQSGEIGERLNRISVSFSEGTTLPARLLADDRPSGLHLLKVEASGLEHIELARHEIELGEPVFAVACVDLRSRAVARGIVTAKERGVSAHLPKMTQTDLNVGPMSAGAPLADLDGKLLGIIAAMGATGRPPSKQDNVGSRVNKKRLFWHAWTCFGVLSLHKKAVT